MTIKINIPSIDEAIQGYRAVIDLLPSNRASLDSARMAAVAAWDGEAADSWASRMDILSSSVLVPTEGELKTVCKALEIFKEEAKRLRQQAARFGSLLGGGVDGGGSHLVHVDAYDASVSQAVSLLKQSMQRQGRTWARLFEASCTLELGGLSLDDGLQAALSAQSAKLDSLDSAYREYARGVKEMTEQIDSILVHLDPEKSNCSMNEVAKGLAAYFSAGGPESLLGLSLISNILAADPVNTATGNYVYQVEDLISFGSNPLKLTRTYNSLDKKKGAFGIGWRHNFEVSLVDKGGQIVLTSGDGRRLSFFWVSENYYATKIEVEKVIERVDEGYLYHDTNLCTHTFDVTGKYLGYKTLQGHTTTLEYDAAKRLVKVSTNKGYTYAFAYDAQDHIVGVTDHSGRKVQYSYEGDLLVSFVDECGYTYVFDYDVHSNLTSITNPRNVRVLRQGFDEKGRILWQQLAGRERLSFSYLDSGHTTIITGEDGTANEYTSDELYRTVCERGIGGEVTYTYDERSMKTSKTRGAKRQSETHYDARGYTSSMSDMLGRVTRFAYTKDSLLSSVERAGVPFFDIDYTADGMPHVIKDAGGHPIHLIYDEKKELVGARGPGEQETAFTYDEKGNLTALSVAGSVLISATYDALGRVLTQTDSKGVTKTYTYDDKNRVTSEADGAGNIKEMSYDGSGNVIAVYKNGKIQTCSTYTDANDIATVTDAQGKVTKYSYDEKGNLIAIKKPSGQVLRGVYDKNGNLIEAKSSTGEHLYYTYDVDNRCTSITETEGKKSTFSYDEVGRKTAITIPTGYSVRIAYDAWDRPIALFDETGALLEYEYDQRGNITAVTDSTGAKRSFCYATSGVLECVSDACGAHVKVSYDELGKPVSITRKGSEKTQAEHYTYDARRLLSSITDGTGARSSFAYDDCGRLTGFTNKDGSLTSYVYDKQGRMCEKRAGETEPVFYDYDAAGLLCSISSLDETIAITHDATGCVSRVENAQTAQAVLYERDASKRLRSKTLADGSLVTYTYNEYGKLSSIVQGIAGVSYAYDTLGRMVEKRYGDDITQTYGYDERNRLVSYELTSKEKRIRHCLYVYDRADNKIAELIREEGTKTTRSYRYDLAGRLSKVFENDALKAAYTYDEFGNRISKKTPQGTTSYVYDDLDRLTIKDNGEKKTIYEYDICGRMVAKTEGEESSAYAYDAQGYLVSADTIQGTITYKYDAVGKRYKKSFNGQEEYYLVDHTKSHNDLLLVESAEGVCSYLADIHLCAKLKGNSVLYIATDELGSPTHGFDKSGKVLQEYRYDEFGVEEDIPKERLISFGFTGYEYDGSGHLFAQARHYDPSTGRFTSEDIVRGSISDPESLNHYTYCRSNPLGFVDRDGRVEAPPSIAEQWEYFWEQFVFGSEVVTQRMDDPGGSGVYAERYSHAGGGLFVWKYDEITGKPFVATGFSVNMPALPIPFTKSTYRFGIEVNYPDDSTQPTIGLTQSLFDSNAQTSTTSSLGFYSEGFAYDVYVDQRIPNVAGITMGHRVGATGQLFNWGEVAEIGVAVLVAALILALVVDDLSGVGAANDFLIPPLLARFGQALSRLGAIFPRFFERLPAQMQTAFALCNVR